MKQKNTDWWTRCWLPTQEKKRKIIKTARGINESLPIKQLKMSLYSDYYLNSFRMDDEEEPEKEEKNDKSPEMTMLMKKLEKYFFQTRSVYLWGAVDDRTAREVTTKMLLLDAEKPGEEIKFFINSPGGVVTSGMVI